MSTDLEVALGEVEPQGPQAEVPVETIEEPVEETGATEEAAEAEPAEAEGSPPSEPDEPKMVPAAVMHGERDRRQKIQEEFEAYKQAHPETPEAPPSVFEDEAAAFGAYEQRLSQGLTETLLNEGKGEAVLKYGQELTDTAEQWFVVEAQKSPMLANQLNGIPMLQQHRKVVEIYQAEQARAESAEDPKAYAERLKAEGVKEYLAQQKAEEEKKKAIAESIPKTLVGDSSKGGIKSTEWTGPTPLNAVIGEGG